MNKTLTALSIAPALLSNHLLADSPKVGKNIEDVKSKAKPNIVMIFTDDQRYDAVGYMGNNSIHTPNLDRLANAGLIFKECFVTTSICCVSRANLITGQYPRRHGIKDFAKPLSKDQLQKSVPGRLGNAGYQTGLFGKWGIGSKPKNNKIAASIFDYWAGQPDQTNYFHEPDCPHVNFNGFTRPLKNYLCNCPADSRGQKGYKTRIGKDNLKDPIHVDSEVTPTHVKRFLDGRDKKKPFCMMVFFKSPHAPFEDWDSSTENLTEGKAMPKEPGATLENAKNEPEPVKNSIGWKSGQQMLKNPELRDKRLRDYYRLISSMDIGVGKIVKELKERGLADNTVILFTSDNGMMFGEHGSGGKWLMYENSLRVPGFIFDPRRKGGKVSNNMVYTQDFSVTMLALAGLKAPVNMDGENLMPLFDNTEKEWRKDFFYTHPYGHNGKIARTVGIRDQKYVYTRYIDPDPNYEQLFDLQKDPNQLENLLENQKYSDLLIRMREKCEKFMDNKDKRKQPLK